MRADQFAQQEDETTKSEKEQVNKFQLAVKESGILHASHPSTGEENAPKRSVKKAMTYALYTRSKAKIPKTASPIDEDRNDDRYLWNQAFLSLKSHEQIQLMAIPGDGQVSSLFTKRDFESLKAEVQRKHDRCEESWKISRQLSSGTVKNIVEAIANPTNADGFSSDLKGRHSDLSHAAHLCETWRFVEADGRLLEAIRAINEPITLLEKNLDTHFQEIEIAKVVKILDTISSIPYTTHHQQYQEKRTTNTCDWVLKDEVLALGYMYVFSVPV
ncbi:hypothetical protein NHQ30_011692 [Ciborinia camelliae]|nr:hypothetical protein NHQ30_011692 [Ciborinia camelliae]